MTVCNKHDSICVDCLLSIHENSTKNALLNVLKLIEQTDDEQQEYITDYVVSLQNKIKAEIQRVSQ